MREIKKDIRIHTDAVLVWRAWTEADRIVEWFAPAAEIEPFAGGKFELYFDPANKASMSTGGCKIIAFEPAKKLQFQWKGPDPFAATMNNSDDLTTVEITLEAFADHTTVTVRHRGWKEDSAAWQEAREWHEAAWEQVLASLKAKLESGEGLLCCT